MDGRKISRLFQFLASFQCFQHFLISPLLPDKLSLMGKICFQLSPFPVKYGNINNIITITSFGVTICTGGASLLSKESHNNSCVTLPTNIGWHYCTWIIYFSPKHLLLFISRAPMTATSAGWRSLRQRQLMTESGAATSSPTSSMARGETARWPRWVGRKISS